MKTSDFFYHLPEELIAQTPLAQRDGSRMLVADRGSGAVAHRMFADFPSFIQPHDVVVVNRSRVIPARLIGKKADSGIACEVLLLRRINARDWEALVKPGRRLKEGSRVIFGDGLLSCEVLVTTPFGGRMVRFSYEGVFEEILDRLGQMPLPPYIHEQLADKNRYQTIYAKEDGSAAAPTAGLHFTEAVFQQIKARGAEVASILLHVGLGTFRPVKEDDVENHQMHAEWYEVSPEAAQAINQAKSSGGRVICVGTTCVRTLESIADEDGTVQACSGDTSIFITPGYRFKAVDMLLTNFHLPQSTLLMLVSAFMGREAALKAYALAVKERYRFFSFGDCMLIGSGLIEHRE